MSARPDALPIEPRGPLDASVRVPGSKSITNRALLLAALAEGESRLHGPLESDDTLVMRESLIELGASIVVSDVGPWRAYLERIHLTCDASTSRARLPSSSWSRRC